MITLKHTFQDLVGQDQTHSDGEKEPPAHITTIDWFSGFDNGGQTDIQTKILERLLGDKIDDDIQAASFDGAPEAEPIAKANEVDWFSGFDNGGQTDIQKSAIQRVWDERDQKITTTQITIHNLSQQLTEIAKGFFAPMLQLQEVGRVGINSPIVCGDLDGSIARAVLIGIQAGIVIPNGNLIQVLAQLMNREAQLMHDMDHDPAYDNDSVATETHYFSNHQSSEENQRLVHELNTHLTCRDHGIRPVIYEGDSVHDRLSCNKYYECQIREKLQVAGAIWINGNHDHCGPYHAGFAHFQFGIFANAQDQDHAPLTEVYFANHVQQVFTNCHYDGRYLYIHNGINIVYFRDEPGVHYIATAFGYFRCNQINSIEQFVQLVNGQAYSFHESGDWSTNFRPTRDMVNGLTPGLDGAVPFYIHAPWLRGVVIVHGHSGRPNINAQNSVIGLNAETPGGWFGVNSIILGRS